MSISALILLSHIFILLFISFPRWGVWEVSLAPTASGWYICDLPIICGATRIVSSCAFTFVGHQDDIFSHVIVLDSLRALGSLLVFYTGHVQTTACNEIKFTYPVLGYQSTWDVCQCLRRVVFI